MASQNSALADALPSVEEVFEGAPSVRWAPTHPARDICNVCPVSTAELDALLDLILPALCSHQEWEDERVPFDVDDRINLAPPFDPAILSISED